MLNKMEGQGSGQQVLESIFLDMEIDIFYKKGDFHQPKTNNYWDKTSGITESGHKKNH